jgi:hypothetical protein
VRHDGYPLVAARVNNGALTAHALAVWYDGMSMCYYIFLFLDFERVRATFSFGIPGV